MGAAAIALALASLAGERIGAGLRRLTESAAAIRQGDLDVSAGLTTDDELGAPGTTFDALARSLRTIPQDPRAAAHDVAPLRGPAEPAAAGTGEALVGEDGQGRVAAVNAPAGELSTPPAPRGPAP